MAKINLGITGCMGRMGRTLVNSCIKDKSVKLEAITENRKVKKKIFGLTPELNNEKVFKKVDVIIDFTIPKCTLEVLNIAEKLKISGTPTFVMKDELIRGYVPFDALIELVANKRG